MSEGESARLRPLTTLANAGTVISAGVALIGPARLEWGNTLGYAMSRCSGDQRCVDRHAYDSVTDAASRGALVAFVGFLGASLVLRWLTRGLTRAEPNSRREQVLLSVRQASFALSCGALVFAVVALAVTAALPTFAVLQPGWVSRQVTDQGYRPVSGVAFDRLPTIGGTTVHGVPLASSAGTQVCDISLSTGTAQTVKVTCPSAG
jgi:hypothetical protein